MNAGVATLRQEIRSRWVGWRRARNLRRASGRPAVGRFAIGWLAAAGALLAVGGAVVIASHARQLGAAAAPPQAPAALEPLRPLLGGASFTVPERGARIETHGAAMLAIVSGMRAEAPVDFDLCTPGPVRIGYSLADAARLAQTGKLALAGPDTRGLPRIEVRGGSTLSVRWSGGDARARFAGDAGAGSMRVDGWLVWSDGALHLWRRPQRGCAAGRLVAQLFVPGDGGAAHVSAYRDGRHASTRLHPGSHTVPQQAGRMEDQALFEALRGAGMVRLGADGLVEVVPRDLAAWRAAAARMRAATLDDWSGVKLDEGSLKLLERLYRQADGAYLREQIAVFNGERRLLAWRLRPGHSAAVGAGPVALAEGMPLAATRLFAEVPRGWAPWQRVSAWPRGAPVGLTLNGPAGRSVELMLAGRLLGATGARVRAADACTGRACPDGGAVQVLHVTPDGPGPVLLRVAPLDMAAIGGPGDAQYRHLRVDGGQLAWRALPAQQALARRASASAVTLTDRHGATLWAGGAPTEAARRAGLAAMLGVNGEHPDSIAGMLARLPGGVHHRASLSIDLGLQALAQSALECVGMRQGRWNQGACSGAAVAPHGREAGMVIVDTETGDILAAAGAGGAPVGPDNWAEVRDFDRANPARSPLRLAALQHDGGSHRSPGSTFKIVTALGLELAARRDAALAGLLDGMPLAGINAMAEQRGYAFRTAAASYPDRGGGARITNYRDGHLDRRAQDGRLGLAQALTYSLNTWFAWSGELSDATLLGHPDGGMPGVRALDGAAYGDVRPVAEMAWRLGFGRSLRLDGGLLPADYVWSAWDALQATAARIDPIDTRHELRQMAIGLRMQATPLQMALVAGAVGQGAPVAPRLLLELDGRKAAAPSGQPLGVRLDRVRAGMRGVVERGTAAGAFRDPALAQVVRGLAGKTGTAPTGAGNSATVWFTGYLEPGSLPGQRHRLALAAFVSHSEATGGEHAAPIVAAVLRAMAERGTEGRIEGGIEGGIEG